MYFVYYLQSEKDKGLYIGKTNDIKRRIQEHNSGRVSSTKSRRPFILLGYDSCSSEIKARELELKMKRGHKREELKKRYNI